MEETLPTTSSVLARARALCGDERAREVLERARLELSPSGERWESSSGDVIGVDALLGVDASAMGLVTVSPSLGEALEEAIAAALSSSPHVSLTELVLLWQLAEADEPAGYRREVSREVNADDAEALGRAVVAWLVAVGDETGARAASRATFSPLPSSRGHVIDVALPGGRDDERGAISRAVTALLRRPAAPMVKVSFV